MTNFSAQFHEEPVWFIRDNIYRKRSAERRGANADLYKKARDRGDRFYCYVPSQALLCMAKID